MHVLLQAECENFVPRKSENYSAGYATKTIAIDNQQCEPIIFEYKFKKKMDIMMLGFLPILVAFIRSSSEQLDFVACENIICCFRLMKFGVTG